MPTTIYGAIRYKSKSYPFFLEDKKVNIVGYAWEYQEDFQNIDEEQDISGVTSDNRQILFLKCRFVFSTLQQKVWLLPIGYIVSSGNAGSSYDFTFEKVSFYSDALNTFYPPQRAMITDSDWDNWDGGITVKLKPFEETGVSFTYKECICKLNISRYISMQMGKSDLGNIYTAFSFEFDAAEPCKELPQYYLALFDFLSFINYGTNINFDKIVLYKRYEDKLLHCADVYIFSNKGEYLQRPQIHTITVDDIPLNKLSDVFSKITSIRGHDQRLGYYFPENYKEGFRVDANRWFVKAMVFEGLFREYYPDFKQNKKEQFRTAKKVALAALNAVDQDQMSKCVSEYFDKCKEQIERYEGLLEETLNFTIKKYNNALGDILNFNRKEYHMDQNEYGKIYSAYRNKIAHGNVESMGPKEVAVYRVLQAAIYFLLLEGTGLDSDTLRTIAKKLFL